MQRYILIRLVQAVVTLLVLSIAVFLSSHLTGDPGLYLLGPDDGLAEYEEMRKNIVLSRTNIKGIDSYSSIESCLQGINQSLNIEPVFVIGGRKIYYEFFAMFYEKNSVPILWNSLIIFC